MSSYNLNFSRAYPLIGSTAAIKRQPEDFQVTENLGFDLSGQGEHLFLFTKKWGVTTEAVVKDSAKNFQLSPRDIGYSGLKDKVALTWQWFSIPWPIKKEIPSFSAHQWHVEIKKRHDKKLKRGVHKENHFCIRLTSLESDRDELVERLQLIKHQGVPNYFAEQRFGQNGENIDKASRYFLKPYKCTHYKRGLYFSSVRSFLFNHYLSLRVDDNNWSLPLEGDCFNLANTMSIFKSEGIDSFILERVNALDIHPCGPLIGENCSYLKEKALDYEAEIRKLYPELIQGLAASRLKNGHRALRLIPRHMTWDFDHDAVTLSFSLSKGGYATSVISEAVRVNGTLW